MDYLLHNPGSDVNIEEFDKECGVGVCVTVEQIKDVVCLLFAVFTVLLSMLLLAILWQQRNVPIELVSKV